ncbi:MAG: copper resistance protein CopZ [Clostridiaceae bacterium]|nr:copper resistance protein CopZ [Clostridiaceae bacterium]
MMSEHVTFIVEGMSCEHCVKTIRDTVSRLNGVYEDLEGKRVVVEYDTERMDTGTIRGTIEDAGYKVK